MLSFKSASTRHRGAFDVSRTNCAPSKAWAARWAAYLSSSSYCAHRQPPMLAGLARRQGERALGLAHLCNSV